VTYPLAKGNARACHIDLRQDELRMFWRDTDRTPLRSLDRLKQKVTAEGQEVVCATNGGMFQQDLRPLGLYVEEGKVLHRLNTRRGAYGNFYLEPNGVFSVSERQARIIETSRYDAELASGVSTVRFATQSGPLLVQAGRINPLFNPKSNNRLIRSAVCLVSQHEVALAISDVAVSFYEFSAFLRDKLKCSDALHLDSTVSRLIPPDTAGIGPAVGVMIGVTREATAASRRK
jgi:uncharacterized protein YigE (DUF2233 family)